MKELWDKLSGVVNEMMDDTLSIEEREFLLARVYHLVDELKQYYIGGNK